MTTGKTRWCAWLIVILSVAPTAQTTPDADSKGTMISGQVVNDAVPPRPLARAVVSLAGPTGERHVSTDDDGRFVFSGLPAGRYKLSTSKAAYVGGVYGAIRPGGPGAGIALAATGDTAITLVLTRGAVLAGTITNPAGEPLAGVQVSAMKWATGELVLARDPVETNDRGEYRIFGLPAGDYALTAAMPLGMRMRLRGRSVEQSSADANDQVLSALNRPSSVRGRIVATTAARVEGTPMVTYATIYFPGVVMSTDAARITLKPGDERGGLDFTFAPAATTRVAGIVTGTSEPERAQITLQPLGPIGDGATYRTTQPSPDGSFAFSGLRPGRYRISARGGNVVASSNTAAGTRGTGHDPAGSRVGALYAVAEAETGAGDVDGVVLALQPGAVLSGRIQFDGAPPPTSIRAVRLTLTPAGRAGLAAGASSLVSRYEAVVQPDGRFTIAGIGPGTYALKASLPTELTVTAWSPRSALSDDRDLLDGHVELEPGQTITNLVVTIASRSASLVGRVLDETGMPTPQGMVLLFSTDPRAWQLLGRRTRIAQPGNDGTFVMEGLPPGEYYVVLLASVDPEEMQSPSFLERASKSASRVMLGEGQPTRRDLKLDR